MERFSLYFLEKKKDIEETLVDFLSKNYMPNNSKIHGLGDDLEIEPDKLEAIIYGILTTFTSGGRAKERNITEKDVDPEQLKMGIDVEMEHVNPKSPYAKIIAKRIALDHLAELKDYYTRLEKVESK